jgi:hypothetical protein
MVRSSRPTRLTGTNLGLSPVEVDEAIAGIEEVFSYWRDANHVAIEIGGRKRFFNPANIVWAEIVY